MIFVIFVLCYWMSTGAEVVEVKLQTYKPPTQEELFNAYFKGDGEASTDVTGSRTKKSVLSVSDRFYESLENIKAVNWTGSEGKKNGSDDFKSDVFGTQFFKNYLTVPIEPTTYRYPTAVWSSQTYEMLKNSHKNRPSSALKRLQSNSGHAFVGQHRHGNSNFISGKSPKRNRGKTKWKDAQAKQRAEILRGGENFKMRRSEFVDKFLEQSLTNYLVSSNLKETVGNVSVKTFSEILRNVTENKGKRPHSPYDENKELRMKFREEVILKKKNNVNSVNETKTQGKFLEKQLQKRLEKVQDMFNERDKDKILANMWKYAALNRTADTLEEIKRNRTEDGETETTTRGSMGPTTPAQNSFSKGTQYDWEYSTTRSEVNNKNIRGSVKFDRSKHISTDKKDDDDRKNLLKLTAEESSYYRQGRFPSLTFIGQPEKLGVIPGTPYIDYPVHSFPPTTKFKCPKFKDEKPKMMADRETRCQVFYVCTGDGPTTAMLCPNGTMFNENFLVCDWWYNVHC